MKREFERSTVVTWNAKYITKCADGSLQFFDKKEDGVLVWSLDGWGWGKGVNRHINFSDFWLHDNERRKVQSIVFSSEPDDGVSRDTFRTCAILRPELPNAAAPYDDGSYDCERAIKAVKYLLLINSGSTHEGSEPYLYMRNWFAHAIQHRHKSQHVMLILSGDQGAGKDSLMLIFERIFGLATAGGCRGWYGKCTGFKELLDKHSNVLVQKSLVYNEEGDDTGIEHGFSLQKLNSIITSDTYKYNEKNQKIIDVQAFANIVTSCNKGNPLPPGSGTRRYHVFNTANDRKGDTSFWNTYYGIIDDPRSISTMFAWFMTLDVSAFQANSHKSGPDAVVDAENFHEVALHAEQELPIITFIGTAWPFTTVTKAKDILPRYIEWCRDKEVFIPPELMSVRNAEQFFGANFLINGVRSGLLSKNTAGGYARKNVSRLGEGAHAAGLPVHPTDADDDVSVGGAGAGAQWSQRWVDAELGVPRPHDGPPPPKPAKPMLRIAGSKRRAEEAGAGGGAGAGAGAGAGVGAVARMTRPFAFGGEHHLCYEPSNEGGFCQHGEHDDCSYFPEGEGFDEDE